MKTRCMPWLPFVLIGVAAQVAAQQSATTDDAAAQAELAKKLQNPVASLISFPLQNNFDFGFGPEDALRYQLNVQPVIPFSLGERWNLITRTIVPVIHQEAPVAGGEDLTSLGDILQSFFFSPKEPVGGWILGAGPVLGYPTASEQQLGSEKWLAGGTFVALRQIGGWTVGALGNHLWSFAGDEDRSDVSATFLQPFVSFTTKTRTTFGFNTESVYDWENEQWTVPLNWSVSQLLKIGSQPFSVSFGPRYYAEKPQGGPEWGLRFAVTLLFPK